MSFAKKIRSFYKYRYIPYIYLDLPNDTNVCFFRNYCFLGELALFSASERFWVLGRFGALGPPIMVLTKIWNGVISRPKSVISRPKSVKINQVGRHSLAAKTPNMKRRYFWKRAKNIPNSKKSVVSTSSDNFAQPQVPGIYIYIMFFISIDLTSYLFVAM